MSEEKVNINKERYKEVKEELSKRIGKEFTQNDLADLWGYSFGSQCSKFITGKEDVTLDRAQALADLVGWRLKYITGEDNYKTMKDLNEAYHQGQIANYSQAIDYLKSLGIDICINPYLVCKHGYMMSTFEEKWKDRLQNASTVFDSFQHFKAEENEKECLFQLKSDISWFDYHKIVDNNGIEYEAITHIDLDKVRKNATKDHKDTVNSSYLYSDFNIVFLYDIEIGKTKISHVPQSKMIDFFITMDNLCKTAASGFLSAVAIKDGSINYD